MAKFTPGLIIGSASGSVGGNTISRNRYGLYVRTRAIPTNPNTSYQQNVRSLMSTYSSAWSGLTNAQRLTWFTWAQGHPATDALGQKQILTGHICYVQINTRLALVGETTLDIPPVGTAPDGLTALTLTGDIGIGTFEVAFTPTPLGATEKLWINAAVVASPGINYIENLLKLCYVSQLAQTSPVTVKGYIEIRFGTLGVGQKVVVLAHVFDTATGLLSVPRRAEVVVTETS